MKSMIPPNPTADPTSWNGCQKSTLPKIVASTRGSGPGPPVFLTANLPVGVPEKNETGKHPK
jgi:hypothetical protein